MKEIKKTIFILTTALLIIAMIAIYLEWLSPVYKVEALLKSRSSTDTGGKQYYYAESDAESTSSSQSFQDKTTLTFTPDENSTYYILSSHQLSSTNADRSSSQLINNTQGTTFASTTILQQTGTDYFAYGGIGIDTFTSAPAAQTYIIQYKSNSVGVNAKIKNARIFAIKAGSQDQSATSATRSVNVTSTYADKTTLTFTPATTGDYIVIASADLDLVTGSPFKVKLLVDSTDYGEVARWDTAGNPDLVNWTQAFKINLDNTSHTLKIQYADTSTGTLGIRNARIIALRADAFRNLYSDYDGTRTTTASTSYIDSESLSQIPQSTPHLILASQVADVVNSAVNSASANFLEGATTKAELMFRSRQSAATQSQSMFTLYQATLTETGYTWKEQFKSTNGGTVGDDEASMNILQLSQSRTAATSAVKVRGNVKFR